MIRKIILPVRGDGKGNNVFAHAAALAHRFDAQVVVTHCRPRPADMLPFGVPIPGILKDQLVRQAVELADQEEGVLKTEFIQLAEHLGLKVLDKPNGSGACASWIEESGRQVDVIKHHGRLADLIVVAQPDVDRNLGANTLKSALFHTGRPVLMCPPTNTPPKILGEKLTIAWNGSTEAARAVALTIGIIERAQEVTLLSAGTEIHGASSSDLESYLATRGITAKIERFQAKMKIGEELLARTKACGADLMIMGAYGDSHERETVFGGNTQVIVDKAEIPVILVH
ncbi:universal stress protein [Denitrobaculum tricleocarpae]|uniref:Universal stress protein n=1 Tax=Denitrobaculum tricleocarpae TaxID=2591009 RepID=A0A545TYI3_9PROT|nr:universal stress protein [Denitrobaculum tricleocarpae]TQV82254.1 universal stress protein [Denitrobaculum tricleocarpae]